MIWGQKDKLLEKQLRLLVLLSHSLSVCLPIRRAMYTRLEGETA